MKRELDILIIEDVALDAEAIERELRDADLRFRARRIESSAAFLQALRDEPPDIVLSDFTLPQFNALAALHLLKAQRPDIPFILVTGNRSEEVAVECIREGADDYILKASLKRLPISINIALQKKAIEQARRQAEQALRRSEEQYRLITEHTRDLISLVGVDGRFLYVSRGYETALGFAPEELLATEALALVHPEDRSQVRRAWRQSLRHRDSRTAEFRMKHRSGEWRCFEATGNWVFDEQQRPSRSVIVSRDTTRRKLAEAATRELPQLIRAAQEAERRRVARDLHDSVNQILAAVKFRLQSVEGKLVDQDESILREVLKAEAHLEKAMQEVRRISRNLRPSELDDLGLGPALRTLCGEFGERTGLEVELSINHLPPSLPDDLELHLYRIIQEALGNVEKHARAGHVSVKFARTATLLRTVIRDDGRGFNPAKDAAGQDRPTGMGLVDMRERSGIVGGNCTVRSLAGVGTEIIIEMPLRITDNAVTL